MNSDSPCRTCSHLTTLLITDDSWAGRQYMDDCEEGTPQPPFGSEYGCYLYDERKPYEDDDL